MARPLGGATATVVHPDTVEARALLAHLLAQPWTSRADLVGVQGARAGSGRADGEFWEVEAWFLKTRAPRRFDDAAAAATALVHLAGLKARLGALAPARTVLAVLVRAPRRHELWTIAPRLVTLRERLDGAAGAGRWPEFDQVLAVFASALGAALALSLDDGLGLDANPANFAIQGARLRYLDDDVVATGDALGVEDAFVARFAEYPAAPPAVWAAYVRRVADELLIRLPAATWRRLGLADRLRAAATLRRGAAPHVAALVARVEGGA